MNKSRIDEIRARCEAATEGPWLARWTEDKKTFWVEASDGQQFVVAKPYNAENFAADNKFITHSITDIPDLVDEVERLQKDLKDSGDNFLAMCDEVNRLRAK